MSKEYSLKDLYNEQSEEEDSDFVLEENEESEGSEIEESETEEESTATVTKKRCLEETEDPLKKKAKMDAIWKEMNDTKPTKEKVQEGPSIKERVIKEEPERKETTKVNRPKSILSSLVSQYDIKIPKMNTLEKSKLDWQKFVEKEDIQDDLKYKNKDGYMEKVEFLQRVDDRRRQQLKTGQKTMASVVLAQQEANVHYTNLLNASLLFYEAQRSGKLPSDHRITWRHDSALEDGSDHQVDLTGGYYDAGLPLSYSLMSIAWSASVWFEGYERSGQVQYLDAMLKWGLDWLMRAHPDSDTFYVQVGDGNIDNNYWGPDTTIPSPRPSYPVNRTTIGTDAVAMASAALASASYLYQTRFKETRYADQLRTNAASLFNLASTAKPWTTYTTSIPALADYYRTNNYTSQLTLAALWMYKATDNSTYRSWASTWFDDFRLGQGPITVWDWSDQTNAVFVLGAELDRTQTKYARSATRVLEGVSRGQDSPCTWTADGLLWCEGFSQSNSLVPAQNMALLSLLYADLDSSRATDYRRFAAGQLDYLLGRNRMLTPYVCGIHPNSPHNPHHAGASGGTDLAQIETSPAVEAHLLVGAVVGGPDREDRFYDHRQDWAQTEVALDYNAPFQGLIAYQIYTNASDPPYVTIDRPRPVLSRPFVFPGWLVAVVVISALFVVTLVGYLVWWKRGGVKRAKAAA
ncbi:hypothetical protein G6F61_010187 [Rhizopus arrhizus]|nr:hypothetical protein G6F61_010187 [Rhizopus arrhizus]